MADLRIIYPDGTEELLVATNLSVARMPPIAIEVRRTSEEDAIALANEIVRRLAMERWNLWSTFEEASGVWPRCC